MAFLSSFIAALRGENLSTSLPCHAVSPIPCMNPQSRHTLRKGALCVPIAAIIYGPTQEERCGLLDISAHGGCHSQKRVIVSNSQHSKPLRHWYNRQGKGSEWWSYRPSTIPPEYYSFVLVLTIEKWIKHPFINKFINLSKTRLKKLVKWING